MMTISKIDIHFTPRINAFYTLRDTAHPESAYAGFNVCHYVSDDPSHVRSCRNALCNELGISAERLIIPRQTHSTNVKIIDTLPTKELNDTDALVTAIPNVALCINTADCVPVVLADSDNGIIGIAHSGWRGTVANIAARTVDAMVSVGADIKRIKASFGACICASCFEVGNDVADIFTQTRFPENVIKRSIPPRPHIDLVAAITHSLIRSGIPQKNIDRTKPMCSHCNDDTLFSARTLGIASGRTLTAILLRY